MLRLTQQADADGLNLSICVLCWQNRLSTVMPSSLTNSPFAQIPQSQPGVCGMVKCVTLCGQPVKMKYVSPS